MYSPPQKVTYRDLPDQPVEVFYGQTRPSLAANHQDISTPRRKTRVARGRQLRHPSKRRRSDSKEKDNFGGIPECTPDTLPAFVNDDDEDNRPNLGNMCWQDEPLPQNTDLAYAGFVEAVLSDECSFYQLSQKTFVANGWNPAKNETNVRVTLSSRFTWINQSFQPAWYHLQRTSIMDDSGTACLCPMGKINIICVHIRFLRDYGDQRFPFDERMSRMLNGLIVCVLD